MVRERAKLLVHDLRLGLRYGYPACCITHYCWDALWGRPPAMTRWGQIAPTDLLAGPSRYVPCGVFHTGGSALSLLDRLHAIRLTTQIYLSPTRSGRAFRSLMKNQWRSTFQRMSREETRWFSEQHEQERRYWDDGGLDPELDWE